MADPITPPDPAMADPQGDGAAPAAPPNLLDTLRNVPEGISGAPPKLPGTDKPWIAGGDFVPWTLAGRALEGAVQDTLALEDLFHSGPPKQRPRIMGEPESIAGEFATGALEFASFFIPARFAVGAATKVPRIAKYASKAGRLLPYLEDVAAGGAADFMISSQGAALSGFLATLPNETAQSIGSLLASEPDETQFERRLKGTVEGYFSGAMLSVVMHGLGAAWGKIHGRPEIATKNSDALAKVMPEASGADGVRLPQGAADTPITPTGDMGAPEPGKLRPLTPEETGQTLPREPLPSEQPKPGDVFPTPVEQVKPLVTNDVQKLVGRQAYETLPEDVRAALDAPDGEIDGKTFQAILDGLKPAKGDLTMRRWEPTTRGAAQLQTLVSRIADRISTNDRVVPLAEQTAERVRLLGDMTGDSAAGASIADSLKFDADAIAKAAEPDRVNAAARQLAGIHAYVDMMEAVMDTNLRESLVPLSKSVLTSAGDRQVLGDFVDTLSFQLMLSADVRPIVSEMARGLGLRGHARKFSVSAAEAEVVRQKWLRKEPLSPMENVILKAATDKSVAMGALAPNANLFNEAASHIGGEAKIREAAAKIAAIDGLEGAGLSSARILSATTATAKSLQGGSPKLLEFGLEWFVNFILSGPKSILNVVQQQTIQGVFYQPLRRAAGANIMRGIAKVSGNREAMAKWAQVSAGAMGTMRHTLNSETMSGMGAAIRTALVQGETTALHAGEGTLAKTFAGKPKFTYDGIRSFIQEKLPNADPDGPMARMAYWLFTEKGANLGYLLRTPGRVFTAADEWTKQWVLRSNLMGELETKAAIDFAGDPVAAATWSRGEFDRILKGGQLQTESVIRNKALETARTEGELQGWGTGKVNARAKELADAELNSDGFRAQLTDYVANQANEAASTLKPDYDSAAAHFIRYSNDKVWPRFFVPFVTSSYSSLSTGLRPLNPIGWLEALKNIRVPADKVNLNNLKTAFARELLSQDPRQVADAVGRMATAATLVPAIYAWASVQTKDGLPAITGAGPKDPAARKLLMDAGWMPYSVRIGNQYVSIARADPIAAPFGAISDLAMYGGYASDDDMDAFQRVGGSLFYAVQEGVKSKTYLKGVADMLDLITGELNPKQWAQRMGANFIVPNALTQIGQGAEALATGDDPVLHETRSMMDEIEKRMPWFDKRAPLRRNVLGDPIEKGKYLGLDAFSPVAYNDVTDDTVRQEFAKIGARFGQPARRKGSLDLLSIVDPSGTTAYDRWQNEISGARLGGKSVHDRLKATIAAPWYGKLRTHEEKQDVLRGVIEDYRGMAYWNTLKGMPELRAAEASQYAAGAAH